MPSDEGGINIDDLLKRIDAKIAELEEEEAREEAQKDKETAIKEEPRVIEPTINEEPKIVETPQIHEEPIINEEPTIIDNPVIEEKPIVEEKPIIGTEIQKPSVNVDADSIVMENHITDDEFFDDFFGEDE